MPRYLSHSVEEVVVLVREVEEVGTVAAAVAAAAVDCR